MRTNKLQAERKYISMFETNTTWLLDGDVFDRSITFVIWTSSLQCYGDCFKPCNLNNVLAKTKFQVYAFSSTGFIITLA